MLLQFVYYLFRRPIYLTCTFCTILFFFLEVGPLDPARGPEGAL